ncbi:MAG: type IV secretion protein DotN [Ketobacter sp.]|nr:MAG: type IV secretion protein DotN [Ketobacter sp.]
MGLPKEFIDRMLLKEMYTCHFCGFTSRKYQEVVVRNGQEWHLDNVKAACVFCAQGFTIDWVANMRSGVLLHLPKISQNELNHLLKVIYVFRISQGDHANKARDILDLLMKSREQAKKLLSSDDPYELAKRLRIPLSEYSSKKLKETLSEIRLLPLDRRIIKEADLEFNQFPQILAYWRSKDGPLRGGVNRFSHEQLDVYIDRLKDKKK